MVLRRKQLWRYTRALAVPVLLWCLVVFALKEPLQTWLQGEERYDEDAVREWISEARVYRETLPEMVANYLGHLRNYLDERNQQDRKGLELTRAQVLNKREEIGEYLKTLATPPTKVYAGLLPLFPIIFRLEVRLDVPADVPAELREPIVWDSELPRRAGQYRKLDNYVIDPHATLFVHYQLHAYNQQQHNEQLARDRLRWLSILAVAATALGGWWMLLVRHRERERERQQNEIRHQIGQAERLLLQEEVRRQEAERKHQETARQLLEQQLATQAAQGQALELKSQLYASIGIMAGSYAHNIKNLLVRPNDLLRRCLETEGVTPKQEQMIHEVQQTIGTVTERLQQILRTVRRDPSRSELVRLDLNNLVRDVYVTWKDLAREKWKLNLTLEVPEEKAEVEGDLSHLQQAVENLVFNARDATFEMRNHLRDQAHRALELDSPQRRQALIDAAAWRGSVVLRVRRADQQVWLDVIDNGIGMAAEVRARCTETHFSTKRDKAVYEGISTGMGLGLSFVVVILEHHGAKLEIDSEPLNGTTMRVRFTTVGPTR